MASLHDLPQPPGPLSLFLNERGSETSVSNAKDTTSFCTSQLYHTPSQPNHHSVETSTCRFPPEILGEIFLAYPFSTSSRPFVMGRLSRRQLVQLTLVCKQWREAALSVHRLWAAVEVDGVDARASVSYEKVVSWLGRAGDVPRTLAIRMNSVQDCPALCMLPSEYRFSGLECSLNGDASLPKLVSEGPQLHTLEIQVRSDTCFKNFAKSLYRRNDGRQHQGTLRTLYLAVPGHQESTVPQLFPSVRSVHLAYWTTILSSLTASPGFIETLTSLSLPGIGWQTTALSALSACQLNLQELSISLPQDLLTHSSPTPIVHFRKVTALRITVEPNTFRSQSRGTPVLEYLQFPALTTLDIANARQSYTESRWQDFFRRHHFVKSFKCRNTNGAALEAAFEHFSSLNTLSVAEHTTALVFEMARSISQNRVWLPDLEHLELLQVRSDHFDFEEICDFLLPRTKGKDGALQATKMKSIKVEYLSTLKGRPLCARVEKLLRSSAKVAALRENGTHVTIASYQEATLPNTEHGFPYLPLHSLH